MKKEKKLNIVGIIIGALFIIAGIVFLSLPRGYSAVGYTKYGADFYTDQYNATRFIVNNTDLVVKYIALYAGIGFILVGLIVILEYSKKIILSTSKNTLNVPKIADNDEKLMSDTDSLSINNEQATVESSVSDEAKNEIDILFSEGLISEEEYNQALVQELMKK